MIYYHTEDIKFNIINKLKTRKWIKSAISSESKTLGEINYIFCSDDYLLKINQDALNHDYYTDIITFDYCEDNTVSGDLFISLDRVKENAKDLNQTFQNELARVMIHGVIHLCGYADKSEAEAKVMREKENENINKLNHCITTL